MTDNNGKKTPSMKMHGTQAAIILQQQEQMRAKVFKKGQLDARAFKNMIYERQAGSITGPKNSLAVAQNANQADYLEDSLLLHGLSSFGITIKELCDANLKNLSANAYKPIEKRFKDQAAFVDKVQENLQSPVVRSLRSIVGVVKPKGFGISRVGRFHSVPSKSMLGSASINPDGSMSTLKVSNSALQDLQTVNEEGDFEPVAGVSSAASILHHDNGVPIRSDMSGVSDAAATFALMPLNQQSSLQPVAEATEHDSEARGSQMKQPFKNQSVPKLNGSGVNSSLTPIRGSNLLSPHRQESTKSPNLSRLGNLNRSSSMNPDSSVAQNAMNLSFELNTKLDENDRFMGNASPNYLIQPYHHTSAGNIFVQTQIPPMPNDIEATPEEYNAVYNNILRKYRRRNRNGKLLTTDPMEFNKLTDQGYQLKAERYGIRRKKKKMLKKQRSVLIGGDAAVRGETGYQSSTESSLSSRSSVSYAGVPEADLEHMENSVKKRKINDRRNDRRASKWKIIFDQVVNASIKEELSQAMISNRANLNPSHTSDQRLPPNISQTDAQSSDIEPTGLPQQYIFSEAQKNMRQLMDHMEVRLKKRLLENIDEEIPEEYVRQKEQEEADAQYRQTTTTITGMAATGASIWTPGANEIADGQQLDQIEQSIQDMMQSLAEEIAADGDPEEQQIAQRALANARPVATTVPSYITNQASFIAGRHELSNRIDKFRKTNTTSPRFYDNTPEQNVWTAKMSTLERGHISSILNNNHRAESLHKLALHLRGENLIPADEARGQVPNGFNQKMPLDKVTIAVGKHIFERSKSLKAQRQESLVISPSGTITQPKARQSIMYKGSPSVTSTLPPNQTTQMMNKTLNQSSDRSFEHNQINPNGPNKSFYTQGGRGRNSDRLMQDVNAVMTFFANNIMLNSDSNERLDDQKELRAQKQLENCLKIEKTAHQESRVDLQPEIEMEKKQSSVICRCNHQSPHRHVFLSPSSSLDEKNLPGQIQCSDKVHSVLIASQDEMIQERSQENTSGMDISPMLQTAYNKPSLRDVLPQYPSQLSNITDEKTPRVQMTKNNATSLIYTKAAPRTDQDLGSELKNYDKNTDIEQELSNFKKQVIEVTGYQEGIINSDSQQLNSALQAAIDTEEEEHTRLNSQERAAPLGQQNRSPSSKKGNTYTVLFKSDNKIRNTATIQQREAVESPMLQRVGSQDEKVGQILESARYLDVRHDQNSRQNLTKHPSKQRKLHQISIQNQRVNHREIGPLQSRDGAAPLSARQLASVSVRNIELPSDYTLSKQQMPQNQRIVDAMNTSGFQSARSLNKDKPKNTAEIALQTSHERLTQQSFFELQQASQPQIEPQLTAKIPRINFPNTQQRHLMVTQVNPLTKQNTSNMTIRHDNSSPQVYLQNQHPSGTNMPELDEIAAKSGDETDSSHILIQEIGARQINQDLNEDAALTSPKQPDRAGSMHQSRRQQVQLNETNAEILKVKGRASNMHMRGEKSSSPSRTNADLITYKTIDEVTASKGEPSNVEFPRAIYNHEMSRNPEPNAHLEGETNTDGTAYAAENSPGFRKDIPGLKKHLHELGQDSSRLMNYPYPVFRDENGNLNYTANVGRVNISPMRMRKGNNYTLEEDNLPTSRVVRNFKPGKTKKLPDMAKNFEQKLSQLADSNVSPLGLFNQDLHAKREWNKLMVQKNFNATVHERRMSLSGKFKDEDFMPLSPLTGANRTTNQAMMITAGEKSANDASPEKNLTRNNSNANSGDANSVDHNLDHSADNSTLQSHPSALNVHRMQVYEKPTIHLMSHNAAQRARKASHQPRRQALHAKLPQAEQKVIVFNFKGNQDLPEEILKRFQLERLQAQQMMETNHHGGSKPLLLSNNISKGSGIFSPKRNSVNVQDSVSIYTRAKAALVTEANTSRNSHGGIQSEMQSLAAEIQLREERSRYESTVRQRLGKTQVNPVPQSTSLSAQKFLRSRRQNPSTNNSMQSQKVSPFKPMGGGFKQNLIQDVSPARIEKEVAATREMLKAKQKDKEVGWNPSRQVSFQSLEHSSFETYENAPIGFNIEQKPLTRKPSPSRIMQDVPEEDAKSYSSVTKDKIGNSMLQLNQQLMDFKPSDLSSNDALDRKSQGASPYSPTLEGANQMTKLFNRDSKSSTEYPNKNNTSTMMKNFEVPKAALMPPPVKEAIQTNDSLAFSKIVNAVGRKKKSQSPKRGSPQRSHALSKRKESSGVPYPLKSHMIGNETLQGFDKNTSFNQSNRFMSSSHMNDGTNQGTGMSPPLEGTRMRLSPKMTGQKAPAPFDQTADSKLDEVVIPRKRLSPKTLKSIKGGTSQNPIKMDKLASSKLQSDDNTGTHSRMRTASRGFSQNISASRPDLSSKAGYNLQRSLHNRQNSMENLHSPNTPHKLGSMEDREKKRQVVGLLAKDSLKSSVQVAISREELERTILSSKQARNLSLLDVQSKLTSMENGMRTVDSREPALMDNPTELRDMHERLQIAEKGIADLHELVSQKRADSNINEPGAKHQYISSVAGLQLGAQNYRRKNNKKGKSQGLRPNFEFASDKAAASLSRILGNKERKANGLKTNQLTVHMEPLRESDREQTVQGSRDTEVLVNMSTQHRDLGLSIGGGGNNSTRQHRQGANRTQR